MKTVLVTGASSGIGKETARRLLDEGYRVYGAARRVERMRELEDAGGQAVSMDITRDEDVVACVERIESEAGGIDVLVNNAGFGLYGAMEETDLDEARYQFEVNLFGLGRLTQLALPSMREKGEGTIVNLSSMGGRIYTPLGSWYHASKHALEGWSDCLRIELAPFGIDVVVIQPGAIETQFGDVMVEPMLDRSGEGPYSEMARSMARRTQESYEQGDSSPPSVIAETIVRALRAKRPRTRYAAGKYARLMMGLRKWLGDRMFDRILKTQF